MCLSLIIHSFTDEILGYFQALAINKTDRNICVGVFVDVSFQIV